jgi:hypothetical protein
LTPIFGKGTLDDLLRRALVIVAGTLCVSPIARAEGARGKVAAAVPPGAPIVAAGVASKVPAKAPDTIEMAIRFDDEPAPLTVVLYQLNPRSGVVSTWADCKTPCVVRVQPGAYRLLVHATSATRSGERPVLLERPSTLWVSPDSYSQRWIGLGLGVGGFLAMVTGFALLAPQIGACASEYGCDSATVGSTTGAILLLSGLLAASPGWFIFARSFSPDVDTRPPGRARQFPSIPAPRAMNVGFKLAF